MKISQREAGLRPKLGLNREKRKLPTGARLAGVALLIAALALTSWLGYLAFEIKSDLERARSSAQQAKEALLAGDAGEATKSAEAVRNSAEQARAASHAIAWNVASAVPLLGRPFRSGQQIADVVAGLANDVLLPAAQVGEALSPDKLVQGNRLDLGLLRSKEPALSALSESAARINAMAQAITDPTFVKPVQVARNQLQEQTDRLAQLLGNTALAARLAPSMLGADGPRSYLMAFQTNAEARATGGLAGAFAVLRFDNGLPGLDELTTNAELYGASASIDLGPDFDKVYGWTNPYRDFRNSNLSPHFPYTAQIWRSMWEERSGTKVDGVIALDPVALSYLLTALGPITMPDGEVVNSENVVELTQYTTYVRFPRAEDQPARKEYLQTIAREIAKKLTSQTPSPRSLLDALGRAIGEGRIAVWSSNPTDQALLEETPLAHVLPGDAAPYAQVVINNLSGTKMDYFLKREIEYEADGCDGEMRNSTITVRLSNTATETSLPPYYSETTTWPQQHRGGPVLNHQFRIDVPPGTMIYSVKVIGTVGARVMSVTANGQRTNAITQTDNGHPSFEVQVAIPPGQSGELSFRLSEPTAPGPARVPVQPLIDNVNPVVSVPACQ